MILGGPPANLHEVLPWESCYPCVARSSNTMAKYTVKFAKGRPIVVDDHGNTVLGAVVHQLNFPSGPVDYIEGRKFGPDHRPPTVDIEVNGVRLAAVSVQSSQAGSR